MTTVKLEGNRALVIWLSVMAFVYVALAITGFVRFYSPVQRWDMWTAYLDFYIRASHGDWLAWFAQHAEHRLFFSRLFFWLDIRYFGGEGLFLAPLNFVLLTLLWLTLYRIAHKLLTGSGASQYRVAIGLCLVIFCFSAAQIVTFIWGFAVQNYLALLIPLWAFLSLPYAKSSPIYFWLAVLLGICSAGAMANGLLVMPLLVLMAILLRQPLYRVIMLALFSVIIIALYMHNYDDSQAQGTLTTSLFIQPIYFVKFFLEYLGAPFYAMFESDVITITAGAIFLLLSLFYSVQWFKPDSRQPLVLVLLIFLLFLLGSGLGTAIGRAIYLIHSAVESRYMINLLAGWSVLGILSVYHYRKNLHLGYGILMVSIVMPLMLLPAQIKVFHPTAHIFKHRQLLAVLALALEVDDDPAIESTYPYLTVIKPIVAAAKADNLSVFADPLFKNLRSYIGQPMSNISAQPCTGVIAKSWLIDQQSLAYRVSGWMTEPNYKDVSQRIFIIDQQHKIAGVALIGEPRVNNSADLSGFDGYVFGNGEVDKYTLACSKK